MQLPPLDRRNLVNRKIKTSGFKVHIGLTLGSESFAEIEQLAKQNDVKVAHIARALLLRGLAAYRRDGQLNEVTDIGVDEVAACLNKAQPPDTLQHIDSLAYPTESRRALDAVNAEE